MSSPRTLALTLLLGVSIGVPASAQNMLTNPGFAAGSGLSGWNFPTGTFSLAPDSASCSLSDSAQGLAANVNGNYYLQMYSTECLLVDSTLTPYLWLGAMVKSSANVYARLYLARFSDTECLAPTGFTEMAFTTSSATWSSILDPVAIPDGTHGVQLWADTVPPVVGLPQYTGAFDQFYVGTEPIIFADGFEAESSTCSWSSTIGG